MDNKSKNSKAGIFEMLKEEIKSTFNIAEYIDTNAALTSIKESFSVRGPNAWILAFSVVIASVGLNVNSAPVIIGAMLISPLMSPIIGIGAALATRDEEMLYKALKDLAIMAGIALIAATIYFRLTPLRFANPTELEARTNPTFYDVLIAFFGGLAGIFEISRKESSKTVIPGVAIATALMPPLCTVGYGLAHMNPHFIFGALYLFIINLTFIASATYLMCWKVLKFPVSKNELGTKRSWIFKVIYFFAAGLFVLSIYTAGRMVGFNNFERKVNDFVAANRYLDRAYIYDTHTDKKNGYSVTVHLTGENIKDETKASLIASAATFGIKENQIIISQHATREEGTSEIILKGLYDRAEEKIVERDAQIKELENELSAIRANEIPYIQITQEVKAQYPEIQQLSMSRGETVSADSLFTNKQLVIIASSKTPLGTQKVDKLTDWLKIRLEDSTVVVINQKINAK